MKTKLKNFTTLDKVIYSLYGIAVVLFIASVMPTLFTYDFRTDFVIAYAVRFTPYLVLGVTAVFSNRYNVRRLVTLNLIYLAICFFISAVTDFSIILVNANEFIGIDNIPYYMFLVVITLFLAGVSSHCSNGWIYGYGYILSLISIARAVLICIDYDEPTETAFLTAFSMMAYFITLIAVAERFSEDNKYTNSSDKIFGDIADELIEESDGNRFYIHGVFEIMAAKSIADEDKNISNYYEFYNTLKKSDFIALAEKGFLNKEFIAKFCNFVSAYLDKETVTEQEIVLNNVVKNLANESTNDTVYKNELLNLYCLISKGFVVDSANCADRIDISHNSDNKMAAALSNFTEYPFEMDGVQIKSMESFLQSLKFKSRKKQMRICRMSGKKAKRKGKFNNIWKLNGGNLYWQGKKINRFSDEYQKLLNQTYATLFDNSEDFRSVLLSTIDENGVQKLFAHSIGKDNPQDTILTADEFTDRLYLLRNYFIRFSDELVFEKEDNND